MLVSLPPPNLSTYICSCHIMFLEEEMSSRCHKNFLISNFFSFHSALPSLPPLPPSPPPINDDLSYQTIFHKFCKQTFLQLVDSYTGISSTYVNLPGSFLISYPFFLFVIFNRFIPRGRGGIHYPIAHKEKKREREKKREIERSNLDRQRGKREKWRDGEIRFQIDQTDRVYIAAFVKGFSTELFFFFFSRSN